MTVISAFPLSGGRLWEVAEMYTSGRVLIRSLAVLAVVWTFQVQFDSPQAGMERRMCVQACRLRERACQETCFDLCSGDGECIALCLPYCHDIATWCMVACREWVIPSAGIISPDSNPAADM
jgi:hypothetical protein